MKTVRRFLEALVLLVVATSTCLAQAPAASPSAAPAASAPIKPAPKARIPEDAITPAVKNPERHQKFLEQKKQGKIDLLFLGDSITDFWPERGPESWRKFAQYHPANFAISGDRTEHVLWRITNGELDGIAPKVTVIMIGTNNIGHGSEEPAWAAEGIKKIVETVKARLPQTKILLLAVFPRNQSGSRARLRVDEVNKIIAQLDDGDRVRFLDIGGKFLDETGEIPADVMPDKLHPATRGYDIWYESMQPTLDAMMK